MGNTETNHNIDPRLLEHLNRHKLTRLVSLLAEAEITSKDLVKFRRNPTLVSGVLPKVRDQLDFTDSLRNVTIDQGAQTDITFFKDLGNTNNVVIRIIINYYKMSNYNFILLDSHANLRIEHERPKVSACLPQTKWNEGRNYGFNAISCA